MKASPCITQQGDNKLFQTASLHCVKFFNKTQKGCIRVFCRPGLCTILYLQDTSKK